MADGVEPPPFDNEDEVKEDDDLFSDAKEKTSPVKEVPLPNGSDTAMDPITMDEPVDEPKEIDLNDDDDDMFKTMVEPPSEIKLDSEDEDVDKAFKREPESSPFENDSKKAEASAPEPTPFISVSQETKGKTKVSAPVLKSDDEDEEEAKDTFDINIRITEHKKIGDGMGAYIVFKVVTKTSNPAFRKPENVVFRRFSDFLGLHSKLAEKHVPLGVIVPPAPEKSVLGMTKVKMSKEDSGSADFVERRRASLERYLVRTSVHTSLVDEPDFIEFLEKDGDLPKSSSTSALSGAGMLRMFTKVGDALEKIVVKVDETDEWFQEKQQQVEAFDLQLRKLHSSIEALSAHRRDLSMCTASFAKSAAMLGNVEEHTALSRALSQLAETEEKIEVLHRDTSEADFFVMAELMKDYVALMQAVKDVFQERVKVYRTWKDAEATLGKKREAKAKFETQGKIDKVGQTQAEIAEWERSVEKGKENFQKICKNIRKEIIRFEKLRINDFKNNVIKYLEVLMENQEKLIKYWEAFLPEAKAIA